MYAQLSLANLESASPTFPFFEKEVQQAKSFVESNKTIPLLSRRRLLAELEHKQKLGVRLCACCLATGGRLEVDTHTQALNKHCPCALQLVYGEDSWFSASRINWCSLAEEGSLAHYGTFQSVVLLGSPCVPTYSQVWFLHQFLFAYLFSLFLLCVGGLPVVGIEQVPC